MTDPASSPRPPSHTTQEAAGSTAAPPACERCGTRTYATSRRMRTHGIQSGRAVPADRVIAVWRCPACGREAPRA